MRAPATATDINVRRPRQYSLVALFLLVTYLCLLAACARVAWHFRDVTQERLFAPSDWLWLGMDRGFFALFLGINLISAAVFTHSFSLALASRRWRPAPGVIVRSEVVEKVDDGVSYVAEVAYSFEIQGTQHVGDTWTFNERGEGTGEFAQRVTRRYPVGKKVTVYCDPTNPGRNCLEPGAKLATYALVFAVVSLLGLVGTVGFVASWC